MKLLRLRRALKFNLEVTDSRNTVITETNLDIPSDFDAVNYLLLNPDVQSQGLNPENHYLLFGKSEGRTYKFGYFELGRNQKTREHNLLIIIHDLALTGSPLLALAIAENLNKKFNVFILSLTTTGYLLNYFKNNCCGIYFVDTAIKDDIVSQKVIEDLLSHTRIDFAIVNSSASTFMLSGLTQKKIPSVTLIHELLHISSGDNILEALQKSTISVFSTHTTADAALRNFVSDVKPKIEIVPQGKIDHKLILDPKSENSATSDNDLLQLSENKIKVLGVGSFIMTKGPDLFLQIAENVETKMPNQFQFIWVGNKKDLANPEYGIFISEYLEKSELLKNVLLIDQTNELDKIIQRVDIFALTSRLDTLPNVAIEALSAGKPVLCFDQSGGIPEYLKSDPLLAEFVVKYLSVQEFATKLVNYAESREKLASISELIKEKASIDFSFDEYTQKLVDLCFQAESILGNSRVK